MPPALVMPVQATGSRHASTRAARSCGIRARHSSTSLAASHGRAALTRSFDGGAPEGESGPTDMVEQVANGVALARRGLIEEVIGHGFDQARHALRGGFEIELHGHHSV